MVLPEQRTVEVASEEIVISKLSLGKLIELSRVVSSALTKFAMDGSKDVIDKMAAGEATPAESLLAVVSTLDEDHLAWLMSVLCGKPKKWAKKNVDVDAALDILIEVSEVQNLGDVVGKVKKLVENIKTSQSPST